MRSQDTSADTFAPAWFAECVNTSRSVTDYAVFEEQEPGIISRSSLQGSLRALSMPSIMAFATVNMYMPDIVPNGQL